LLEEQEQVEDSVMVHQEEAVELEVIEHPFQVEQK
jgi:hypothetical protein